MGSIRVGFNSSSTNIRSDNELYPIHTFLDRSMYSVCYFNQCSLLFYFLVRGKNTSKNINTENVVSIKNI